MLGGVAKHRRWINSEPHVDPLSVTNHWREQNADDEGLKNKARKPDSAGRMCGGSVAA